MVPAIPEHVRLALTDFRRHLEARFSKRLQRTVLFGSYARGEAGPESDVDVLVVVDQLTHPERTFIHESAADLWMDSGVRLAPLALSTTEHADLERRELLIAQDIASQGIPV